MRFHVKNKKTNQNIFIGFAPPGYRFVFYTHGTMYSVSDWEKAIKSSFENKIYDEDPKGENCLDWDQFMQCVEYWQYNSNARWVNNFRMYDGYNFSHNSNR